MTELLCETDAYLRDFEARVLAVEGQMVVLDRTAFYPGGGGQPCDKGAIIHQGVVRAVKEVRRREGMIWHALLGTPPPPGGAVLGHIDWQRRFGLMRIHTALHILSAVIFRDFGVRATGGEMKPLAGGLDVEFQTLTLEIANTIESRINEEVAAARPVRVITMPREEAVSIPDLIRTEANVNAEGNRMVRVVEIEGLDLRADQGIHVTNTREVGPINLVGHENKGRRNKRLRIELAPAT